MENLFLLMSSLTSIRSRSLWGPFSPFAHWTATKESPLIKSPSLPILASFHIPVLRAWSSAILELQNGSGPAYSTRSFPVVSLITLPRPALPTSDILLHESLIFWKLEPWEITVCYYPWSCFNLSYIKQLLGTSIFVSEHLTVTFLPYIPDSSK